MKRIKKLRIWYFNEELLIETLKKTSKDFLEREREFAKFLSNKREQGNLIDLTKQFISYHNIDYPEGRMKSELSQNIDRDRMKKEWLLDELNSFFYSDEVI